MDITLSTVNPYSQTLTTIVYLSVLSKGYTCKDISVQKSTLQGYMRDFVLYSMANCGRNILLNPETDLPTLVWKEHQMIKLICDYQSCMKGPTNKKDSLTKRMITHMQERVKGLKGREDCFQKAFISWLVLSLTTGYRGIEWLQEHNINCDHDFTY